MAVSTTETLEPPEVQPLSMRAYVEFPAEEKTSPQPQPRRGTLSGPKGWTGSWTSYRYFHSSEQASGRRCGSAIRMSFPNSAWVRTAESLPSMDLRGVAIVQGHRRVARNPGNFVARTSEARDVDCSVNSNAVKVCAFVSGYGHQLSF